MGARWRLRSRLLAFGVTMSIVPLLLMALLNIRSTRASLLAVAADQVQGDAALVAADLERAAGSAQSRLQAVAENLGPTLLQADQQEQERVLYGLLRGDPRLDSLCLLQTREGGCVCASRHDIGGPRRPAWVGGAEVAALQEGEVGPVRVATGADGRPLLHLALPLRGEHQQELPAGLVARVSLRGLLEELPILDPERRLKPVLMIVDRDGRLVGHGDFSRMLAGLELVQSPPVQHFVAGETQPAPLEMGPYRSADGREVLGALAPVPSLGWAVVAELPLDEALRPLDTLAMHFLYASLIIMAAVVGLSIFFALRFGRPLEELAAQLVRMADGDLSPVPHQNSPDEIGLVARALSRLADTLRRQRRVEDAMVRADRLATLGLMTAGLAHELNNPLASVQAYAEEMEERLAEEPAQQLMESGELPQTLQVIRSQTARCKGILQGLLAFSRKPATERRRLQVEPVIENALTVLRYRLRRARITVQVEVDPAVPPVVAEEGTLEQVLVNLMTNAVDALAGEASRTGREPGADGLPPLQVRAVLREGGAEIRVEDRGPGLTPEELERVWDPFFTTKPPGQGTGLGLPVCRELIAGMGGRIQLESRPGEGTAAVIWLPAASAGKDAPAEAAPSATDLPQGGEHR